MTGLLVLSGDPSVSTGAATKNYVDTNDALHLLLSGGTMTGTLTLAADPTANLQAATKQYVDVHAAGFTFPDAPSDGNTYARLNGAWTNVIDAGTY
jgi:hypothetical protein